MAPKPARTRVRMPRMGRIHLASVHVVVTGFTYNEDLYERPGGVIERVVCIKIANHGELTEHTTRDKLCAEEWALLQEEMPFLMDAQNPELAALMEQRARFEYARQRRIAAGEETACAKCGCSNTKSCSGGCIWVSRTLCSRCV